MKEYNRKKIVFKKGVVLWHAVITVGIYGGQCEKGL